MRGLGWLAVVLALAMAGCGQTAGTASRPSASPSAAATAAPTSGGGAKDTYLRMMIADSSAFHSGAQEVARACKSTVADCRASLRSWRAALQTWQRDLDTTPPPDCLTSVDRSTRQALTEYDAGITARVKALDSLGLDGTATADWLRHSEAGNAALDQADQLAQGARC